MLILTPFLLQRLQLVDLVMLPQYLCFLKRVNASYKDVPYHNSAHATDLAQTLYIYLSQFKLRHQLSDLEQFALITAGCVHDMGHFALNNGYLIHSKHEIAIRYND